jgi:hypothetical protein
MKRIAIICGVLTAALFADGTYMELANYQPGDQDPLFGNPHFIMSDGTTVLIAGGFLLIVTVVMWLVAARRGSGQQRPS